MRLSIVVPCYNEQEVIRETNRRLGELGEQWVSSGLLDDYEVIYVDDGSSDSTLAILHELADADPRVRAISFSTNAGHQAAILAGMHHAGGDAAVTLDADLQDPPETIAEMIEKVRGGAEVVYGVRRSRTKDTFFKRFSAHTFYRLLQWMGVPVVYDHADFRLATRPVLDALKDFPETSLFMRGIFPSMGFRAVTVEYERPERYAGETKYSFGKMLKLAIDGITSFTYSPLRLALPLGTLVFLISVALAIWALVSKFVWGATWGWASTVIPLYLFGGVQLVFIGLLGEYIGKIFQEVKRRPRYIVREYVNFSADRPRTPRG